MDGNKTPFPQANHFERIINILSVEDAAEIKDKVHLCALLGDITKRQVQYYLSACEYLGLTTSKHEFTQTGENIRRLPYTKKIIQLARVLVSDPIIGTVYLSEKRFGYKFDTEEIVSIIMQSNEMSEEVYKRRAQTVVSWTNWLNKTFNDHFDSL